MSKLGLASKMKSKDEIFGYDSLNINKISEMPIDKFLHFEKHPFKMNVIEIESLAESIKEQGVLEPIIARPIPESDMYEVIAGHRRLEASKLAELATIPTIIRNVSNYDAVRIMMESNFNQRKVILPSERAFSYKLQYDELLKILNECEEYNMLYMFMKSKYDKADMYFPAFFSELMERKDIFRVYMYELLADLEEIISEKYLSETE